MSYKLTTHRCAQCDSSFTIRRPVARYCSRECYFAACRDDAAATPPGRCAVEGCDQPHHCKGYCQKHYVRWRKYGDPHIVNQPKHLAPSTAQRFWAKVDRSGGPDACWPWTASKRENGYGQYTVSGKNWLPHRYAYTEVIGPIPEGMDLDHLCRNPACVNPAHLEPVTHRENVLRSDNFAAHYATQTRCKHGHELTPENIYLWRGTRYCRECRRSRRRPS